MSFFKSKADRARDVGIKTAIEISEYSSNATFALLASAERAAGTFSKSPTVERDVLSTLCGILAHVVLRMDESRLGPAEIDSMRDSLRFSLAMAIAEVLHGVHGDESARAASAATAQERLDLIASRLSEIQAPRDLLSAGAVLVAEEVLPADVDSEVKDQFGTPCLSAIASGLQRIRPTG